MSPAIFQQVQRHHYRITLDITALGDFAPENIDWEQLFELQGSERVIDSYVEDLSRPVSW